MRSEELRMRIDRYMQVIKLKYDIKREYFTIAIPVTAAVILILTAVLAGHTFFIQEESSAGGGEEDARLAAYQTLVEEMEKSERVFLKDSKEIFSGKDIASLAKEMESKFNTKAIRTGFWQLNR